MKYWEQWEERYDAELVKHAKTRQNLREESDRVEGLQRLCKELGEERDAWKAKAGALEEQLADVLRRVRSIADDIPSIPFSEGIKLVSVLLVRGWSCPGKGKVVASGVIPAEGWRAPDGRENLKLMDALVEENLAPKEYSGS